MDARRNQVYSATFLSEGGEITRLTEDRAISLSELSEELKKYSDKNIYLVGDGYDVARRALCGMGISVLETPYELRNENAASVGRVGVRKYEAGEWVKETEISPVYLRLPQAERERLERLGNN
jgi:tRNA threonylcarbamoyladenosine biosynthesis protein TsaB